MYYYTVKGDRLRIGEVFPHFYPRLAQPLRVSVSISFDAQCGPINENRRLKICLLPFFKQVKYILITVYLIPLSQYTRHDTNQSNTFIPHSHHSLIHRKEYYFNKQFVTDQSLCFNRNRPCVTIKTAKK